MLSSLQGALFDGLPLIPLAVAFVWTMRYQGVADLSLAGSFAVSAGCMASLLNSGLHPLISITLGLLVGVLVGLAMGITVNLLHIEPLMAGLVVLFITYALSLGITEGTIRLVPDQNPLEPLFAWEARSSIPISYHAGMNLVFLTTALVAVALTTFLLSTERGCAFRALEDLAGGRPFLVSLGISPTVLSLCGFAIAGALSSISGVLVALRDRQTTTSLGLETLIDVIPAYLLGVSLFELRPSLSAYQHLRSPQGNQFQTVGKRAWGVARHIKSLPPACAAGMGVLVFFFFINLVQRGAFFSWLPRVLIGIILLIILGIDQTVESYLNWKRKKNSTYTVSPNEPLRIQDVAVSYPTTTGANQVLNGITIAVAPAELVLLTGSNGSGKTTLLRALADRINCSGTFFVPFEDVDRSNNQRARLVAYVPQDCDENTVGTLSIAEHAVLAHRATQISSLRLWKDSAQEAVEGLGVQDVAPDSSALLRWLSGGQRRRVLLGLLLVRKPRPIVVALDEPFNDLDAAGRRHAALVLTQLKTHGHAILFVDHQRQFTPTRIVDISQLNTAADFENGGRAGEESILVNNLERG